MIEVRNEHGPALGEKGPRGGAEILLGLGEYRPQGKGATRFQLATLDRDLTSEQTPLRLVPTFLMDTGLLVFFGS